jgi:WD40 repeat protein
VGARHARDRVWLNPHGLCCGHGPLLRGYPGVSVRNGLLVLLALAACACSSGEPPASSLAVAPRGLHAAAFPNDGSLAVVASLTQGASLWDLRTQQRSFDWNHRKDGRSAITAVAFSPEGNVAITAEGNTLVLWDARKGEALRYFSAPSEILSVALTRGGTLALLGLQDGTALLMDAQEGGVKRRFTHEAEVLAVAIDPDGRRALSGSADGSARLWDTQAAQALQRWEHGAPVELVALSDDATKAFSAAQGAGATLRDTDGGQILGEPGSPAAWRARSGSFTAAAFSADGSVLALGTVGGRVLLWDTASARERETWKLPRGGVARAAGSRVIAFGFSAAGLQAASGDGVIHLLRRPSAR